MQYLDKIFATYVWNTWNISNIHLQHTCIVIATYATPDLLLQHPDETHVTCIWNAWNIQLQHVLIYLLPPNEDSLMRARRSEARAARSARHGRGVRHEAGPAWGTRGSGVKQVRREAHGRTAWGGSVPVEVSRFFNNGPVGPSLQAKWRRVREHYRYRKAKTSYII